jgi:GH25 family lysozyme M1 (1,4-beta-N-acetylmuramidase)
MSTIKGIDISAYQPTVDFVKVKAAGIEAVYIKATEGASYINPDLKAQYQGAKAAGLKVGFYHFFRPSTVAGAQAQAEYFVNTIKGMAFDLRPVLDIELNGGVQAAALSNLAKVFLDEVAALTGIVPVVYTYLGFIAENLTSVLAGYPLWLADYANAPGSNPIWPSWAGWQYSQTGAVSGISGNVDLDVFTDEMLATGVIIEAGSQVLIGQLVNGSTLGPIAAICNAKGIPYTWDASKQTMCINGAKDASWMGTKPQIAIGNQVILGQIFGSSMWGPVAPILKALNIAYSWKEATRTLNF